MRDCHFKDKLENSSSVHECWNESQIIHFTFIYLLFFFASQEHFICLCKLYRAAAATGTRTGEKKNNEEGATGDKRKTQTQTGVYTR